MTLQKKIAVSMMFAVLAMATGTTAAYAGGAGMSLTATAEDGSDVIMVEGRTTGMQEITVQVLNPSKAPIWVDQLSPGADGMFNTDVKLGGMGWMEDGKYTIVAQQGEASLYKLKVSVMVMDGMVMETMETKSTFENAMVPDMMADNETFGLEVEAMWEEGNPMVPVTGTTDKMQEPITLTVTAPNGNVIQVDQIMPDMMGGFETEIITGCESWEVDGDYTVSVQQGDGPLYQDTAIIPVAECTPVPEFGTIAALVLAAALVSIIAVSARSRLSIIPRY